MAAPRNLISVDELMCYLSSMATFELIRKNVAMTTLNSTDFNQTRLSTAAMSLHTMWTLRIAQAGLGELSEHVWSRLLQQLDDLERTALPRYMKLNCRLCKNILQNDTTALAKLQFKIARTGAGGTQTDCQSGMWISDLSRIPEVLNQIELWQAGADANDAGKQLLKDVFGGANDGTAGKQAIAQMKQQIRGLAITFAMMNRQATSAEIAVLEEFVTTHHQITQQNVDAIVKMLRARRIKDAEKAYRSELKSGKSEALVA